MKITVGNVCFIINKNKNEVLFLERLNEPMSYMYTGVGGKTSFNEDIYNSCVREIKEETGLIVKDLKLRAVIKTILNKRDSSWILFVYTSCQYEGELINCNEGNLVWINLNEILNINLIGFIREILPEILINNSFIEGTIIHDIKGNVIDKHIHKF